MSDTPKPVLGHFTTYRLTSAFWGLEPEVRAAKASAWFSALRATADRAHLYLTQGIETESDVLVWSTVTVDDASAP